MAAGATDTRLAISTAGVFLLPPTPFSTPPGLRTTNSASAIPSVTERAFNSCSLGEHVLRLDDGNSIFNLTVPGYYYFTSGVAGHCKKNQKLVVAVPSANGTFFQPPAAESTAPPSESQSYPIVFGPTPAQGSSGTQAAAVGASAVVGSIAAAVLFLGVSLM
ncbi:hypothetical protein B296_00045103 [Ensete ventricosum]|uniref:Phytocyanin domain-containing protein n=1 Tax=Ensete ventricosum TaxID=4639 RepID=A0A426XZR2_ENSVE|nr:hypothetical protein B296_00045103 [Ensete ventricosum]